MEAVLDVEKKYQEKKHIKKVELEYGDREYIIFNLIEKVIDVDGSIFRVEVTDDEMKEMEDMILNYLEIDEYEYWPDKNGDHAPMGPLWRISFYDEVDTYYHKSGATKYPEDFMKLVDKLKGLKQK